MNINNECKIVEDLLLPYLDGTLNSETKEIVDKHFEECEICKQKLKELKTSMIEEKDSDKKCIDYLKKARRKERIKTIKWILILCLVIFLIVYFRNFVILNKIYAKRDKFLLSDNVYVQRVDHQTNNSAVVTKYYYKDGKCKIVYDTYIDDGLVNTETAYTNMESNDLKRLVEDYVFPYDLGILGKMYYTLGMTFFTNIHLENINDNFIGQGKECYVLIDNNYNKTWYDKDTGLKLKQIVPNVQQEYYRNTNILKSTQDQVTEFKFEFNMVIDEDVIE